MEPLSIIAIIMSAGGFWKLLEIFLGNKKYSAEVNHLHAQVNSEIINNWISWSKKLEDRVIELEGQNENMQSTIETQKEKIQELDKQLMLVEQQNELMTQTIEKLKNQHNGK